MKHSAKNYTVDIFWEDESQAFVASCREIPACAVVSEEKELALQMAYEAIEDHLNYLSKRNRKAPLPLSRDYSGKVLLRMPKSLHRLASEAATSEGTSLNQYISFAITEFVTSDSVATRAKDEISDALNLFKAHCSSAMSPENWNSSLSDGFTQWLESTVTREPCIATREPKKKQITMTNRGTVMAPPVLASKQLVGTEEAINLEQFPYDESQTMALKVLGV